MADLVTGAPVENANCVAVTDKLAQRLARLVPVDEKDERGTDRLEERLLARLALRLIPSLDEIEGLSFSQPLRLLLGQPAPAHRKGVEQIDEELGACLMHICMGDRHCRTFDTDEQHMGIGRADIVLDDEPLSRTDRNRIEARVIEFEAARAIEAAHESADQRPVLGTQAVGVCAGDHLFGALRGEPVEVLVQVHDRADAGCRRRRSAPP